MPEITSTLRIIISPLPVSFQGGESSPGLAEDRLQVFLKHIESSFVQSSPSIREGLMHIIPFLTFGDPRHMNVLLQHFEPYLDFEK